MQVALAKLRPPPHARGAVGYETAEDVEATTGRRGTRGRLRFHPRYGRNLGGRSRSREAGTGVGAADDGVRPAHPHVSVTSVTASQWRNSSVLRHGLETGVTAQSVTRRVTPRLAAVPTAASPPVRGEVAVRHPRGVGSTDTRCFPFRAGRRGGTR